MARLFHHQLRGLPGPDPRNKSPAVAGCAALASNSVPSGSITTITQALCPPALRLNIAGVAVATNTVSGNEYVPFCSTSNLLLI